MSKSNQDEWSDLDLPEAPITPEDKTETKYAHNGWMFYVRIRSYLNDWWQEFNSDLDKKQKPKYKTVRKLAEAKFKKSADRDLFYLMTCSYEEWEACARADHKGSKMQVPWLGDWYKRRKNGYWQESNSVYIKTLKKTIKENHDSTQAIKATAPFLVQEMMRYSRLQSKIEQAFGGEAFLDEAPTTSANKKRFEIFVGMLQQITTMKVKLIHEWMRIHGVNPNSPNEMWNMAALAQSMGQVGAASALTGVAASQQLLLNNPGSAPTAINRDSLLMADHLLEMTNQFKEITMKDKEIVSVETKDKHGKSNGKHATQ